MKKNNMPKFVGALALLVLISIGASYAYFTATISGSEGSTTITVGSGTLGIAYSGGSNITMSNVYPRSEAWAVKTFTLTGNNSAASKMRYQVNLNVTQNTFSTGALKYKMTSTNTGLNGTPMTAITADINISTGISNVALGTGEFDGPVSSKAHTYVLSIFFPDSGNQNADQGKAFQARLVTTAIN